MLPITSFCKKTNWKGGVFIHVANNEKSDTTSSRRIALTKEQTIEKFVISLNSAIANCKQIETRNHIVQVASKLNKEKALGPKIFMRHLIRIISIEIYHYGWTDIIEALIKEKVNIAWQGSIVFIKAVVYKKYDIVYRLLQDERIKINPMALNFYALIITAERQVLGWLIYC